MKNQIGHGKIIGFFLLAVMLCLSACGAPAEKEDARQPEAEEPVGENALPGTWTVPEGWVKAEKYSTENKIFYVEEGHEEDEQPDNISIEVGTNRYSVQFVTTENRTKETIRQRLQYYRTLDIAEEQRT